ncbi:MAG: hypothetical protein U1F98_11710 [Verrucomicrobiota bacterium]
MSYLRNLILWAVAAAPLASRAEITGVQCTSDSYLQSHYYWNYADAISMTADQYSAATMQGTIWTDSPEDPTLTIGLTINNDTGFPWTAYHINVSMSQVFTISSPTVANPGWTAVIQQQPVWNGSTYLGQLEFTGGSPVGLDQLLSLSYQITFTGATQYAFGQELIPVPEPSPASLLALAGLLLFAHPIRARLFAAPETAAAGKL